MEITELSLAPRRSFGVEKGNSNNYSSSSESENNFSGRKRKFFSPSSSSSLLEESIHTSVDLHVKDPLPMDWEQCLDLESGRMYYLNRKTLRKSWKWPNKDQKLDLELHISVPIPPIDHEHHHHHHHHHNHHHQDYNTNNYKKQVVTSSSNMVALACLNCHLLVILSKSSPSCPNCKYVHSLPLMSNQPPPPKLSPSKSLHTLSLLD